MTAECSSRRTRKPESTVDEILAEADTALYRQDQDDKKNLERIINENRHESARNNNED